MPRYLVRFLPDLHTEWLPLGRDGAALAAVQTGLPPVGADDAVVAVAPAEDVLLLDVPRPPGNARQLAQALPFAIEDRLAVPVETQHVAWTALGQDRLRVAVIARVRLQAMLDALRSAGIEPTGLLPEARLLPGDGALVLAEPHRVLLRPASGPVMAVAPDEIPMFLGDAPAEAILAGGAAPFDGLPAGARQVGDTLALYARALDSAGPDLLQGEFAPARRRAGTDAAWRRAGIAVAALLLAAFAHAGIETWQLSRLVDAQQEEMASLYRRAVPGASRIIDPAQQLRAALAASGQGGSDQALGLLAAAAPVLAARPDARLDAVEYRSGVLELTLNAEDVAGLDSLRAALAGKGLRVELVSATPGSRGIEGRLRLLGSGA